MASKAKGNPYENLANAIILQAVMDYRMALKAMNRNARNRDADGTRVECERFFQSGWFSALTDLDGVWLMQKLRKEAA